MTDMKRVTISIPEEMDNRVVSLRKREEYARCSYSELVREMVLLGLKNVAPQKKTADPCVQQ